MFSKEDNTIDLFYGMSNKEQTESIQPLMKAIHGGKVNWILGLFLGVILILINVGIYYLTKPLWLLLRILLWMPFNFLFIYMSAKVFLLVTRNKEKDELMKKQLEKMVSDKIENVKIKLGMEKISWHNEGQVEVNYSDINQVKFNEKVIVLTQKTPKQTLMHTIKLEGLSTAEKDKIISFLEKNSNDGTYYQVERVESNLDKL